MNRLHSSRLVTRPLRRASDQRGIALVVALLVMCLLTALGMALMLTTQTETMISANYRDSMEGQYAADAALERVMDDVLTVHDWNTLLATTDGVTAGVTSGFHDTTPSSPITLPDGRTLDLAKATYMINCAKTTACSASDMDTTTNDRPWSTNNPRYHLYAWGAVNDLIPTGTLNSPYYVAVWIADDPAETDDDPLADTNGTISLHAEAFGPTGAHKVIEVTVARTSGTEIERGQIAQRGQEELNQRSRKAAVQTPGKALTNSRLSTSTGNLVVQ